MSGDGYTNHCPACLWSRHVDVNPGDRAADCGGLMRPVGVEMRAHETVLVHRCEECGHSRRNRTSPQDDRDAVFAIAAAAAEAAVASMVFTASAALAAGRRRPEERRPGKRSPGRRRQR